MKQKLLFLFFTITFFTYAQIDSFAYKQKKWKPNEIVYLFGNDVKLRENPTTDSEILGLMPIGAQLQFLETTGETYTIKGHKYPWVKVQYADQIGYIVSSFIALEKMNIYGEVFYLNMSFEPDHNANYAKIRRRNVHYEIVESSVFLPTDFKNLQFHFYDNRKIDGMKNVIEVKYDIKSMNVTSYMFSTPMELNTITSLYHMKVKSKKNEGSVIKTTQRLIFPDEQEAYPNGITYKEFVVQKPIDSEEFIGKETSYMIMLEWKEGVFNSDLMEVKENIEKSKKEKS